MAKQADRSLVSIVVPVYDTGESVSRCFDSILNQTYRNIEIIVVNCGGSYMNSITERYQNETIKLKVINTKSSTDVFKIWLEGFKKAKGDFVAVISNSNDLISVDYIRTMVTYAKENGSDIVVAETVIENDNQKYVDSYAANLPFEYIDDECFHRFFEQQGENYSFSTVHSKMYSRRVIRAAIPFLDTVKGHIVTCEDILFSTIFWYLAKRVDKTPTAYYYKHEDQSPTNSKPKSIKNSIISANIVFAAVGRFLEKQQIETKYHADFLGWMNQYSFIYNDQILNLPVGDKEKKQLAKLINFGDENWVKKIHSRKHELKTVFNDGLESAKKEIISAQTKYVSFDIFDTLVQRPFLRPSDLFYLMERDFKKLDGSFRLESFRNIRIRSEELARSEESDTEDVSLSQIYRVMQEEYAVDKDVATQMLNKELEYEIKWCSQRKTAKELYDLAMHIEKNIIITSDMYLPKKAIKKILQSCQYDGYDKLYISSHHGTMKATQNLYKHIAADLDTIPERILHIGDNYESDVMAAERAGWKGLYFPKAVEVMPDIFNKIFGDSINYAQGHLGVTSAYALAMNEYFDNPFRSFSKDSTYNSSPYFMGYFSVGLSLFGFTKWMIDDLRNKNIDSIVFLSRDGYLPMLSFNLFKDSQSLSIQSNYLPTSRKATIPLSIFGKPNIAEVRTFNYRNEITDSILESIGSIQNDNSKCSVENIDLSKAKRLQESFVNTYKDFFKGNTAVMDIGYSGRPEQVFAKLFNTSLTTYFIYTDKDEARRRLGQSVNIYSRLSAAGLREKIISELGPSCTGYQIVGNKVKPLFDNRSSGAYHEKYTLSEIQRGALNFVKDYLGNFNRHLDELDMGDHQLVMGPLDQALLRPTHIDKEIFRGLIQEDGIAGDNSFDIFKEYYGTMHQTNQSYDDKDRLMAELESHMGIKRSAKLLAGNVKRRIRYGKNR